jgi:hypothetical protein
MTTSAGSSSFSACIKKNDDNEPLVHRHFLQEKKTTSPHFVVISSIGEGDNKPPTCRCVGLIVIVSLSH